MKLSHVTICLIVEPNHAHAIFAKPAAQYPVGDSTWIYSCMHSERHGLDKSSAGCLPAISSMKAGQVIDYTTFCYRLLLQVALPHCFVSCTDTLTGHQDCRDWLQSTTTMDKALLGVRARHSTCTRRSQASQLHAAMCLPHAPSSISCKTMKGKFPNAICCEGRQRSWA